MIRIRKCRALLLSLALVNGGSLFASSAAEHPFGILLANEPAALFATIAQPPAEPSATEIEPEINKPPAGASLMNALRLDAAQQINRLHADGGPYNPELAPVLTVAAGRALELGDTENALLLYQQALYNLRVNGGLYAEAQLPILQSIMGVLRLSGDMEALDSRVDYYYRLMGSGLPPWNVAKIQAALKTLSWRQEKLMHQLWVGREREVVNLVEDGERLVRSICQTPDFSAVWCADITLQHLATLYLIQFRISPEVQTAMKRGYTTMPDWRTSPDGERSPLQDRLQSILRGIKNKGVDFINDALLVTQDAETLTLALADWHWFFGDTVTAEIMYRALYEREPQLFSHPVPLPAIPNLSRDPGLAEDSGKVSFVASVSSRGTPEDITVIGLDEDSARWKNRGLRYFRALRFRPAIDASGQFVAAPVELSLVVMR